MLFQLSSIFLELSKSNQTLLRTRQLHALVIRTHLSHDPFHGTKIIRFYAINGDVDSARLVFEETPQRSVYLWNSIIRAYSRARKLEDAFLLFKSMLCSETSPDSFTYACLLHACAEHADRQMLRAVHGGLMVSGSGTDSISGSALVNAYSKLGVINEASRVFDGIAAPDLVLSNSMISGYGSRGMWDKGLQLFSQMRFKGMKPDQYTVVGLISSLTDSGLLPIGQGVHGYCLKKSLDSDVHTGSVLVSMYSKCGCLGSAEKVIGCLLQPDLVTWSALITGYSQSGEFVKALRLFRKMNREGEQPDPVLIANVLEACARLAGIRLGREIHGHILRHGHELEVNVMSALTDMYMKCGFVDMGIWIFRAMHGRTMVSYNLAISGLGLHGAFSEALEVFEEMLQTGFEPDDVTFSALLCACCHAGLVKDGCELFGRMGSEFGVQAKVEHYVYLVRLLGMNGELEEAYSFILRLPKPVDSVIWGALLACCDLQGDSDMAAIAAQQLFESKPEKATYRVMLSNIYASGRRWDDAQTVRCNIDEERMCKMPGISSWVK